MIKRMMVLLVVLVAATLAAQQQVSVPDAEELVGAPAGKPLTGAALAARTQQVAGEIRCPVCQGLSVADSPSEMAVNMKAQVRALSARGYTETQIEKYFERSYGQFVLLRPKFEGVNSLVWIFPIAALAIGLMIVIVTMRRLQAAPKNLKEVEQ
jgi:cytochrome c-type biogenesis protein CcmH